MISNTTFENISLDVQQSLQTNFLIWSVVILPLALISILANVTLCASILVSRRLHKANCHLLILNLAVADCLASISMVHMAADGIATSALEQTTSETFQIPVFRCFQRLFYSLSLIGFNVGSLGVAAVGLDRFLAMYVPHTYSSFGQRYVFSLIIACWFLGAGLTLILGYITLTSDTEYSYICMTPKTMSTPALQIWNMATITINVTVVILYACTLAKLHSIRKRPQSHRNQVLIRSLVTVLIMALMYILTWVLTMVIILTANVFMTHDKYQHFYLLYYAGWTAILNLGSNCFIYMIRSRDYQQALQTLTGNRLSCIFDKLARNQSASRLTSNCYSDYDATIINKRTIMSPAMEQQPLVEGDAEGLYDTPSIRIKHQAQKKHNRQRSQSLQSPIANDSGYPDSPQLTIRSVSPHLFRHFCNTKQQSSCGSGKQEVAQTVSISVSVDGLD